MPRIRFDKDYVWRVRANVSIKYKAGCAYPVTEACAAAAAAAGAVAVTVSAAPAPPAAAARPARATKKRR